MWQKATDGAIFESAAGYDRRVLGAIYGRGALQSLAPMGPTYTPRPVAEATTLGSGYDVLPLESAELVLRSVARIGDFFRQSAASELETNSDALPRSACGIRSHTRQNRAVYAPPAAQKPRVC